MTRIRLLRRMAYALAALVLSAYVAGRVFLSPTIVRQRVVKAMKEYLSADVAMSEATFDLREGIRMKNVRIRAIHPSQRLIFNARELQLRHRPASLLRSKLEFDQVELVEPVLFVSAEESGEKVMTNLREIFQAIRKPSEKMTRVPTLIIRRGRVALRYERKGKPSSELEVGRIDLALKAHPDRPDTFEVRGRIADDDFGDWSVQGQYDPKANYIRIAATSKQVELGAKLRRRLPPEGQKIWDVFAPAGLASFELFFLFDGKSLDPIRFKLYANVRDGQMTYEGFPYLSSGITGELEFDHRGVRFTNLTADMGNLKAVGSGEFFGYGAEAGLNLVLEATRLPVDQKLRDASSPREREAWERLSPSGLADAVIRLVRDRGPAKPLGIEVDGKVLSGDLTLRDFPYALRGLEGTFHYRDNSVFIDRLTARSDGEEVNLTGQIRNFGKEQGVNLLVEAKNISLDEDLRRALPAEAQDAWEELGLRGTVDVVARVLRSEGKDEPYQPDVTITSRGVRLALRDFPYELKNLEGRLFVREGTLEIERLFSREGETTVTISGTAKRLAHGSPFHIQILGEKVPLDGRLREALAEPERKRWDSLAPEGKVSFVCDVSRDDKGFIRPDIRVKWLGCSFLPEGFPARITDVTGISRYVEGRLELEQLAARLGEASLNVEGRVSTSHPREDAELKVTLRSLSIEEQVLPLLDQASKELWARFTPRGKVDVEGDVQCRAGSSGSPRTDFSLRIGLHDVSLVSGVKGEEILGSASLLGFREGSLSRFEGDVQLRSLKILGQRLRDVEGMFLKEGNLFALHNLSGKIYGGNFEGTARVRLSEPILFGGEATITEMQLEPLAREAFGYENPSVEGKISGRISLQGRGTDPANLVARGELEVRDAKLWELPAVLSMLNLLNLSLPERTAFREASLKYSILNEEALIEEIALKGRAISIYGHGTMGPAGRLDFNFVTGVGPSFLYIPILSDLAREFQHQVAELSVVGTFVRPETRLEARGPLSWPLQALSNIFSKHPSKVPEKENIQ